MIIKPEDLPILDGLRCPEVTLYMWRGSHFTVETTSGYLLFRSNSRHAEIIAYDRLKMKYAMNEDVIYEGSVSIWVKGHFVHFHVPSAGTQEVSVCVRFGDGENKNKFWVENET